MAAKMKNKKQTIAKRNNYGVIQLSQKHLSTGKITVDEEAGTIKNVAVLTKGEAKGHFFHVDDVMLQQVSDAINVTTNGARSRLTHPEIERWSGEDIDMTVGRFKNAKIEDSVVRADAHLADYAKNLPGLGDVRSFLLGIATEDPEIIGLSIAFSPDEYDESQQKEGLPAGRIRELLAVDFVGMPGANPNGLLSQRKPELISERTNTMDELLKKYLITQGLPADATDEEAQTFFDGLDGDEKAIAEKVAAGDPEPEPKPDGDADGDGDKKADGGDDDGDGDSGAGAAGAELAAKKAAETVMLAERKRVASLTGIATQAGFSQEWLQKNINVGTTEGNARKEALDAMSKQGKPLIISGGTDHNRESLAVGIEGAILLKSGGKEVEVDEFTGLAKRGDLGKLKYKQPHERARQFRNLSLVGIGREWLRNLGVPNPESFSNSQIADCMMSPKRLGRICGDKFLAQSTSDFPYILENAMNKTLNQAYFEAPSTWQVWARRTISADLKTIKRNALSESPNLAVRYKGGSIKYVTLSESQETYALAEYVGGIKITKNTIINDDLDAFSRVPMLQANAAKRKEDDVVYAILTANAALADAVALFHATHANYVAYGSGAVPSVTTLNAAASAMAIQTGLAGAANLNLTPKFIIAPHALRGTILELLTSTSRPESSYGGIVNIWNNGLIPVFDSRLDAHSTDIWYIAADFNQVDTIEIAFLEAEQVPQLKQETEFDTGDIKYAVTHYCAAKAIDYRGLYSNSGVAAAGTTASE